MSVVAAETMPTTAPEAAESMFAATSQVVMSSPAVMPAVTSVVMPAASPSMAVPSASPLVMMPSASPAVVMSSVSPSVVMPSASPSVVYSAAPVTATAATVATQVAPQYTFAAGSTDVPVYGASITVPKVYQQPSVAMPTVMYQQSQPMSPEQLKTIFPMGAPCTFQPFTASQYTYNIVESPSAFVAAPVATVPAVAAAPAEAAAVAEVVSTVAPATTMANVVKPAERAVSTVAPATTAASVAEPAEAVAATTVAATSTVAPTSSKAASKKSSKKKLSSKKKQKGCC